MIMGSHQYGARFGTSLANVGDLNMDGYEGKLWVHKTRIYPEFKKAISVLILALYNPTFSSGYTTGSL
jgi:hypothetical protein